jgi:hypothetical protein
MRKAADMATVSYWAIACRECGGMIALALIEFDGNKQLVKPDPVGAFEADCAQCSNTRIYAPYEVMPWEGPLPTPGFKPHPALQ